MTEDRLRQDLRALGIEAQSLRPLEGGDLSAVVLFETSDAPPCVAKSGPHAGTEARMLRALAAAGAPVPRVRAISETLFVMDYLPKAPSSDTGWRDLGHALRRLHALPATNNGWPEDYAFGTVWLSNAPAPDWPGFWAERRLLPFAPEFPDLADRLEALAQRLPELLPKAATGLLHGDLWTGNVHFSTGGAYFIDPACYRGHGEVDLAMLHLFGTPPAAFWDGYGEPAPEWRARLPLYQLFPALVHLRLFGEGYRGLVERCLDACA
ncbi:fructosamine kinase family protein [Celeribacter indicus]|uniref:Fructosamine/ketosamine-3-kinase n=1 Tax=Celeribacter indicus TaxID=1208324 RepID=A0A0B5DXW2_9RHOB|nr:fructosamine kinase family protein [Celeribacter indicus]AJE45980.1 fructosamine/ketosamine-3-kinase [Celeribacter indicus]SDW65359.1 Fructosamine-3-kinase [Celeribacter indicus]